MDVVTSQEMQIIEQEAVERLGITLYDLMERAGQAVADAATRWLEDAAGKLVVIVCGKGNNGGDGFVAARLLAQAGARVAVFCSSSPEELRNEAALAFKKLAASLVQPKILSENNLADFEAILDGADLIIDAIFGFNFAGAPRGIASEIIDRLNAANRPMIAVDIPSGVEADSGQVQGNCIRASETVTFTLPKPGLVIFPGAEYVGNLTIADLGIPTELTTEASQAELISPNQVRSLLPYHRPDVHKKERGRVLVIAGSIGMTGAASLTSMAALRAGAGLVLLGVPASLNPILEQKLTEVITVPLPETSFGSLSSAAREKIIDLVRSFDVVALGPGLSLKEDTPSLIRQLVTDFPTPLVLDADGLNALVGATEIFSQRKAATVITPHPGELARLLGVSSDEIQQDRLGFARRAAARWNLVVVLKGARSIICSPDGHLSINPTGNAGMASAGTGDVLTGLISSLIAQGLNSYNASILGTYLHGLAGDLAAQELTEFCLIAGDLIDFLPAAIKQVMHDE